MPPETDGAFTCLDLYSGGGGVAVGYARAGFKVVGVDSKGQPAYPFEFHRDDAIEFVREHGHEFDFIHASPPCQRYTHGNVAGNQAERHPDLIGPTRDAILATGKPYVIENVSRAPLVDPLVLCGTMFDLTAVDHDGVLLWLQRHRLFESNLPLVAPRPCHHPKGVQWAGSYGGARRDKHEARNIRHGGYVPSKEVQQVLLGIDWMPENRMYQAIPPAYTQWIGMQMLLALDGHTDVPL
jgi:DNA (cytosine-5)-methyltransferase 1